MMADPAEPSQSFDTSDPTSALQALDAVVTALGGQVRQGQEEMARAVDRALASGEHALIQAGTGTGKSIGYLAPAAVHAVSSDQAVVVATATLALQRQLVERDLPLVAEALEPMLGRPLAYAVLKGRNNYVCLNKLHGFVPQDEEEALFAAPRSALGEQVVAVRAWAETSETGDRDEYPDEIDPRVWRSVSVGRRECVGESRCSYGEACFTSLRRAAAEQADIVVTNHALLAIDAIEGIPVLPEHQAVIVDEGHELVDRVTSAAANELSVAMMERAIRRARPLLSPEGIERLVDATDTLGRTLETLAEGNAGSQRLDPAPRELVLALTTIRDATHAGISEIGSGRDGGDQESIAARQHARGAIEEIHDIAGSQLAAAAGDVLWLELGEGRAPVVRMAPLSIAGLLRDSLFARSPVVLTSATLSVGGSFEALRASLGLADDSAAAIDVGSPFDYARQGILYVAADLPNPGRDGVAEEALDRLAELIEAADGRTLALFSSWRGVERAADYLRVRLDPARFPLLVQRRGDPVGTLVQRFTEDERSSLLGTVSLWQGVDVPGSSCLLVVVDRIPFPRPDDPLIAARSQAVEASGGSGFRAVSVPRAGLLLAQGAGRLIRSTQDRGVVAVLDPRLATAAYGATLRAALPPFWYTTDASVARDALSRLSTEAGTKEPPTPTRPSRKPRRASG